MIFELAGRDNTAATVKQAFEKAYDTTISIIFIDTKISTITIVRNDSEFNFRFDYFSIWC